MSQHECGCGHEHACEHGHGHSHGRGRDYGRILSLLMFIAGVIMHYTGVQMFSHEPAPGTRWISLVWYLAAFFLVAWPVMKEAWEAFRDRDFFNEFSLMLLASIGAFCIGEYPEAVAVMLFYSIGEELQERAVARSKRRIRRLLDTDRVEAAARKQAPTEIFLRRVCRVYTPVVMVLAVVVFLGSSGLFWFSGEPVNWQQSLYRALVFLVISCPCALVISIPLCYFAGIGKCSQSGILFKGGNGLDAATEVDTVVFDKTGTLTAGDDDKVKSEVPETLNRLRSLGIKDFRIMSADAGERTLSVARELGIEHAAGGLQPEDKVLLLQKLSDEGRKVCYVGDGTNDSPALACAHLGVSMGQGGSDAAIATCDVVLQDDNLLSLPCAISLSRQTRRTVWQNIIMVFAFKILIMVLGLFDIASLWLAVFADSGVALLAVLNTVRFMQSKTDFSPFKNKPC